MKSMKFGDVGQDVKWLQQRLNAEGAHLVVDGIFGKGTLQAVKDYQAKVNLPTVGQAGPRTIAALKGETNSKNLTLSAIESAAKVLKVDSASVATIAQVESAGSGFFSCGRPAILFERHIFFRQIAKINQAHAEDLAEKYPNICNKQPGGYCGGSNEYSRYKQAASIDCDAAIEACSWGMFQIMGMHWQHLGFDSPNQYKQLMMDSESEHLNALVKFIKADSKLHDALKKRKWAEFAKRYNGPNYKINQYDIKLARTYEGLKDDSQFADAV